MLATKEEQDNMKDMFLKFTSYAPHFSGPSTPTQAINDVLDVIHRASLSRGDAGAVVSQFGNKQWL